jgi:hypothetical protein
MLKQNILILFAKLIKIGRRLTNLSRLLNFNIQIRKNQPRHWVTGVYALTRRRRHRMFWRLYRQPTHVTVKRARH